MTLTASEREMVARDLCRIRTDAQLLWSWEALQTLPRTDEVVLSRAWVFEELDARGLLPMVGTCGDCYLDLEDCDCAV